MCVYASAFLGVERLGVVFLVAAAAFLGAAFFAAAAFLGAAGALVLVTRPDLVLVRTVSSLVSLGAAALRGWLALALGFAAAFLGAAALVVVFFSVVFFSVALVAAFLGAAAFLVVVAFC